MPTFESSFNGNRLKEARVFNNLTIGEVASLIGVTTQSISQFENNIIVPKTENIFSLSNCLGFPREFFYESDHLNITVGNTYFRSLASTSKRERNAQIEKVKMLLKIYCAIETYIQFPSFEIPDLNNLDYEEMAQEIRKQWGLGDSPILNLIDEMERRGIIVASAFCNSKQIDAYSHVETINKQRIPIIILGDEATAFRQQFNAAHELGHILTDGNYELEDMTKLEYKNMETFMNQFAGALLIPKKTYINDLSIGNLSDITLYIELKKKYRVSASALIVRANQLDLITANQYQYLMKQMAKHGYRTEEPYDRNTPISKPRYLKHAMKMIIDDMKISGDDFMHTLKEQNLSISKDMVENLLGLKSGFLEVNNVPAEILLLQK